MKNMEMIRVIEVNEVKASYVERINELLAQLSPHPAPFTDADLREIVSSSGSRLFLLWYGEQIAGMLTVGSYRTPLGRKYWIEDVVVDDAFRGKGLGKVLVDHAVSHAGGQEGGGTLMLTSAPERVAANNLYRSAGFVQKHTNVYKKEVGTPTAATTAAAI